MKMKCVAKCHAAAIPPACPRCQPRGGEVGSGDLQTGLLAGPVGQHHGQGQLCCALPHLKCPLCCFRSLIDHLPRAGLCRPPSLRFLFSIPEHQHLLPRRHLESEDCGASRFSPLPRAQSCGTKTRARSSPPEPAAGPSGDADISFIR